MPRQRIPGGGATALSFVIAVVLIGVGSAPAWARGRTRVDARAGVIGKLWRCLKGKACQEKRVFRGKTILAEWPKAKRKLAQIKVLQTAMVAQVPQKWRAKYTRHWSKYVQKLAAEGYSQSALMQLGLGKSIVTAKRKVALAFMSIKMQRRGRVKTEHLMLVLWKVKYRWYIAYLEDSPRKITAFLTQNKTPR